MMSSDASLSSTENTDQAAWQPLIFDRSQRGEAARLDALLDTSNVRQIYDTIEVQVHDLLRARAPGRRLTELEFAQGVELLTSGSCLHDFGRWVYYPWSGRLVHLLPPDTFRELRLDRNRHKITAVERLHLDRYTVGIVGLSVGNAIANTLALEGSCGYLKLADFDELVLSNMNRLRAGVHELGLRKTVIAARQIFESNPYAQVALFHAGLTSDNLEDFFLGEPRLDVVVDECDDLRIKLLLRERARALRLPVLMETSDRGMVDVERFDQEPERPLFHGQIGEVRAADLGSLSDDEKLRLVLAIVGADSISTRAASSLPEIRQTLSTWPQLASEVALGGASIATAVRRLALGHSLPSGRRYLDIDAILSGEKQRDQVYPPPRVAAPQPAACVLDPRIPEWVRFIVEHGMLAPSGGNCQPWRFYFDGVQLWVIHDQQRSQNLLDQQHRAAYIALGAAIENMVIAAAHRGYRALVTPFPRPGNQAIVAALGFEQALDESAAELASLFPFIQRRATNRKRMQGGSLPLSHVANLHEAAAVYEGRLQLLTDSAALTEVGAIMGEGDRIRFLCRELHQELMAELRWTAKASRQTRDGLDLATLELTGAQLAVMRLIARPDVAAFLRELGGGAVFAEVAAEAAAGAMAIGLLSIEGNHPVDLLRGGQAFERLWLQATALGLALQPMTTVIYMFDMLRSATASVFTETEQAALLVLQARFGRLFVQSEGDLLLFLIGRAPAPTARSLRRPIEAVLEYGEPLEG
ncbi:MAG TPA: Rv1355c family protein [Roseiflexaceae bacterium]|nr:Rv1355c family protein [Roseiflexaceae bacterium]